MYRIQTKGYDAKEKLIIAKDYLLPKIREQVSFTAEEVIIPDELNENKIKFNTVPLLGLTQNVSVWDDKSNI